MKINTQIAHISKKKCNVLAINVQGGGFGGGGTNLGVFGQMQAKQNITIIFCGQLSVSPLHESAPYAYGINLLTLTAQ